MATGPSRGMRTAIGATSKASPRAPVRSAPHYEGEAGYEG
jgi:hypothetical protein